MNYHKILWFFVKVNQFSNWNIDPTSLPWVARVHATGWPPFDLSNLLLFNASGLYSGTSAVCSCDHAYGNLQAWITYLAGWLTIKLHKISWMLQAFYPTAWSSGAEISPWGWKFHARLILGGKRAVPIEQGQRLKAMRGGLPAGRTKSAQPLHDRTRPTPFFGKGARPTTDH